MTDHTDRPEVDPLRAAFDEYKRNRAPKDIVPKRPWTGSNDDVRDLDGQTVAVTYWDRDTGRPVTENIIITKPVFGRTEE